MVEMLLLGLEGPERTCGSQFHFPGGDGQSAKDHKASGWQRRGPDTFSSNSED